MRDTLPFVTQHPGAGPGQGSAWQLPSASRKPKCAPMPARSTLGDHSATVPFSAKTWATPKADALRSTLPTLPGSCRRSSTTLGTCGSTRVGGGRSITKPTAAGDSSALNPANSGTGTITTFAAPAASSRRRTSCQAASLSTACAAAPPRSRQARHKWSPSSHTWPRRR